MRMCCLKTSVNRRKCQVCHSVEVKPLEILTRILCYMANEHHIARSLTISVILNWPVLQRGSVSTLSLTQKSMRTGVEIWVIWRQNWIEWARNSPTLSPEVWHSVTVWWGNLPWNRLSGSTISMTRNFQRPSFLDSLRRYPDRKSLDITLQMIILWWRGEIIH